jgi:hypothetical protein
MNFLRPIAALTSALLHRKPTAPPASRAWSAPPAAPCPTVPLPLSLADGLRRIPRPASAPAAEQSGPVPHRGPGPGVGVRLSLRLDAARHRRLRLAAVHRRRSAQAMLVEALDAYIAGVGLPADGGR